MAREIEPLKVPLSYLWHHNHLAPEDLAAAHALPEHYVDMNLLPADHSRPQ